MAAAGNYSDVVDEWREIDWYGSDDEDEEDAVVLDQSKVKSFQQIDDERTERWIAKMKKKYGPKWKYDPSKSKKSMAVAWPAVWSKDPYAKTGGAYWGDMITTNIESIFHEAISDFDQEDMLTEYVITDNVNTEINMWYRIIMFGLCGWYGDQFIDKDPNVTEINSKKDLKYFIDSIRMAGEYYDTDLDLDGVYELTQLMRYGSTKENHYGSYYIKKKSAKGGKNDTYIYDFLSEFGVEEWGDASIGFKHDILPAFRSAFYSFICLFYDTYWGEDLYNQEDYDDMEDSGSKRFGEKKIKRPVKNLLKNKLSKKQPKFVKRLNKKTKKKSKKSKKKSVSKSKSR